MSTQLEHSFDDIRQTFSEYVAVFRRRWRYALLAISVISSLAFWYSQYLPREYTAATIFERRDDVVLANLIQKNSPYSFNSLNSGLPLELTGSRAKADAAVAIGLLPEGAISPSGALSDEERAQLNRVLNPYQVDARVKLLNSEQHLDTIELKCTASDPEVAREYVIALREQYIARTQERIRGVLERTRDFFQEELARYETRLAAAAAEDSQAMPEFPGLDPSDPLAVGQRLESMRAERDRLLERQSALDAEIYAREQFLTTVPEGFVEVTTPATAKQQPTDRVETTAFEIDPPPTLKSAIEQVEMELADALTVKRMTREHPYVKGLEIKREALQSAWEEIAASLREASTQMVAQKSQGDAAPQKDSPVKVSPVWRTQQLRVEMELDALRKQLAVVKCDLESADGRVAKLTGLYGDLIANAGDRRQQQQQLEADEMSAQVWRQHLTQLERVLAAQNEQRGTAFTAVEEPLQSNVPVKPHLSSVVAIGGGCGLAAALLIIALAELFDRSFRSGSQVTRKLNIPVLGSVGIIDTPKERWRLLRRRLIWSPMLGLAVMALFVTGGLAYASLKYPQAHARIMERVDGFFQTAAAEQMQFAADDET